MNTENRNPIEIEETDLDAANGGIGLLLPAVQKVREAAARTQASGVTKTGAGSLNLSSNTPG